MRSWPGIGSGLPVPALKSIIADGLERCAQGSSRSIPPVVYWVGGMIVNIDVCLNDRPGRSPRLATSIQSGLRSQDVAASGFSSTDRPALGLQSPSKVFFPSKTRSRCWKAHVRDQDLNDIVERAVNLIFPSTESSTGSGTGPRLGRSSILSTVRTSKLLGNHRMEAVFAPLLHPVLTIDSARVGSDSYIAESSSGYCEPTTRAA